MSKKLQIECPETITDRQRKKVYSRDLEIGTGGFAKCYKVTELEKKTTWACKVVPLASLAEKRSLYKMRSEIAIHFAMNHPNIAKLDSHFQDDVNIYLIIELCSNQTLMELSKSRTRLTEPEVRYFLLQLLKAIKYLHENKIIHRDLKLGNIFLNDFFQIKVGDFGLATQLQSSTDRRKTLCGTPNYIAPEILNKNGHGYEVDIWSIGVILYTLLIGKPPFETSSVKMTCRLIKENRYTIPSDVLISEESKKLISSLLNSDPSSRPSIQKIVKHPFFYSGITPKFLPKNIFNSIPIFNESNSVVLQEKDEIISEFFNGCTSNTESARVLLQPISLANNIDKSSDVCNENTRTYKPNMFLQSPSKIDLFRKNLPLTNIGNRELENKNSHKGNTFKLPCANEMMNRNQKTNTRLTASPKHGENNIQYISSLIETLSIAKPSTILQKNVPHEYVPTLWISRWLDYSSKYGLSYQLSNQSVGVSFNDSSKIICSINEECFEYFDKVKISATLKSYPPALNKKVNLLRYFKQYMTEKLLMGGSGITDSNQVDHRDSYSNLVHLERHTRTENGMMFELSNQTVQVNFFDHTKVIVSSSSGIVTFIDDKNQCKQFSLTTIGSSLDTAPKLVTRLRYVKKLLEHSE